MPSLMVVILVLEVFVQLINAVGSAKLNSLLWRLLMLFPSEPARMDKEKRALQTKYLAVRKDMQATSSQDEFAKWARLRRQHDKLYEELEKKKQRFEAVQGQYNTIINVIRFLLTRAPQYILPFWYSREPMFWLPKNLFPYYAEWFLSLPKAPLGSVSIGTWQVACAIAIKLIYDIVAAVVVTVALSAASKKKTAVKIPVASENTQPKETVEEKKEL
ncbi:hypothetical protein TD95_001058 [Thielaviopsis punctulata]|uniref:Uncharacterized protein n=1 Tax=Thielaviopsis punctulata TaxID=72032 RepID=A0A0F4Z8X4_9PEZI|nr:hypothetical protein TD95_001068 [Thielaviopsis punctulata]KKA26952.1 hypothetical protein TD95_001058 [Thielaviopsis punctulata]